MADVILRFKGPYEFLSNFYRCKVVLGTDLYPTLEHAYQAAKTPHVAERAEILAAVTPGKAKRLGYSVAIRPDWEDVKVAVMRDLIEQKFGSRLNPELVRALRLTDDAFLVEGNSWHDCEWGVCFCDRCAGRGENILGNLLMERRRILQSSRDS